MTVRVLDNRRVPQTSSFHPHTHTAAAEKVGSKIRHSQVSTTSDIGLTRVRGTDPSSDFVLKLFEVEVMTRSDLSETRQIRS
jgi:hypothetical protein